MLYGHEYYYCQYEVRLYGSYIYVGSRVYGLGFTGLVVLSCRRMQYMQGGEALKLAAELTLRVQVPDNWAAVKEFTESYHIWADSK